MDVLTLIIAGYGAALSTALGFLRWRATKTRLKIEVYPGTADIYRGTRDPYGNELKEPGEVLFIEIINRSQHLVKVESLGIEDQDGKNYFCPRPYPTLEKLPLQIEERDNKLIWTNRDLVGLGKAELKRIRVNASTTEKKSFRSPWVDLEKAPQKELVDLAQSG